MDELLIQRTLMFPTLASLLEERMRDDPDLIHAVIHSLNEWMYEEWTFNFEDRIFATPVIDRDRLFIRTDSALYRFQRAKN